jgi:amino acid adenylation domain-containing protein
MEQVFEGFRLSPQQKHLWLLMQDEQRSRAGQGGADGLPPGLPYGAQVVVRLEGPLSLERLQGALAEVVAGHEVLRTTFRSLPGTTIPLQVIAEPYEVGLTAHDLSGTPGDPLLALAEAAKPQSFDVTQTPLLQATLGRLAPDRHLLLLSLPSLCADSLSMGNLALALGRAYAGGGDEDEELVQYADVSEIFNEVLESEETEMGREYWQQQQLAVLPPVRLPAGTASQGSVAPARQPIEISQAALAAAQAQLEQSDATLVGFCLACWQALLWRLSGVSPITLGVAYHGRTYEGLEEALGLFARHLPLSVEVEGSQPFSQFLISVQQRLQELHEWQDYFTWEGSGLSGLPVGFEAIERPAPFEAAGLRLSIEQQGADIDQFGLKLVCQTQGDTLTLALHYSQGRDSEAEIKRLVGQFQTLFASAASSPNTPLAALALVGPEEREQLLVALNDTRSTYPSEQGFHQLFEEQAARTPDNIALVARDQQLSYRELNARANQLAHTLQAAGVGPETLVALCLERSLEMVVGLLGVLKAGGAYLPLDPTYPRERLTFMLDDSRAPVVLTQARLVGQLPASQAQVMLLDQEWERIAQAPASNPHSQVEPQNLAYVIYTSGSTGKPKGTMIAHQGLVNYLSWAARAYRVAEGSGAPVHSPLGFDLTVTSLMLPLLVGQRVVLVPEGQGVDELQAVLREAPQFSLVKITPAHLEALRQMIAPQAISQSTKTMVIGGEALVGSSLAAWRSHAPDLRLINEYGPTETVVGCCVYDVLPGPPPAGPVPIGRPIANTQLYLLDERLEPVPWGVSGELYIGGAGVARGYQHRPDLTAERFIPDPFSGTPGARLYKTGDLARYLSDGNLEFLGRADSQVKLRGFRVELGEIEAVLSQHPAVREVAVLVQEGAPSSQDGEANRWNQRLAAFLVAQPGQSASAADLRAFMLNQLPDYMVPSAFAWLEALPLTANGKVDRRALEHLKVKEGEAEAYVAPRTPIEAAVAQVWAELLGRERIGVRDNFFELGGHSLLLIQLNSRLRNLFQIELGLNALFEATTVEAMARLLASKGNGATPVPGIPRRPNPDERPLSFAQQRLWFFDQLNPDSDTYNNLWGVQLRGTLDLAALERSISEVVRRHEVLRTSFKTVSGEPVQVVAPAGPVSVPVVDLRALAEREREADVRRRALALVHHPMDLSHGPLWRIELLWLAENEYVLLLAMHHITSDGWSMDVLSQEIAALYTAYVNGQPSPLPELPIQYADFAAWQRQRVQGELLQNQLAYWTRQLARLPIVTLPADFPRPEVQTFRGANQPLAFAPPLAEGLRALGQAAGASLFMVLLSAFQSLIFFHTQQEDMVVGSDVANRDQAEVEGLIGFFVNQLTLRTNMAGDPTFRELLGRVRDAALAAYANQDVPFEQVIQALKLERSLKYAPLFQLKLFLQHALPTETTLPGLALQPLPLDPEIARLDMVLGLWESPEGITGWLNYNTDLFRAATVARMADQLGTIIEQVVANPDIRLNEVMALLAEREETYKQQERQRREESSRGKFRQVTRKTVDLPTTDD